ncbi:MAG: S8 family serine peptidase [bacterium]|nr:S8 family serine peptidase [bacterium]
MKRIFALAFLGIVCLLFAPDVSAQDRPTFTMTRCSMETLLSPPVCVEEEYLKDEFYVVLKQNQNNGNSIRSGYPIQALQTALSTGAVNEYHSELDRINTLSSVSPAIKDLAATQTAFNKILHIHVKNPDDFNQMIFRFSQDLGVESISFSSIVKVADFKYNDPLYPQQYALPVIKAPAAHEKYGLGSPLSIMAIFDTGGSPTHPDLVNRYSWEYDATGSTNGTRDKFGHGTHVAGIAGARTNNGEGVASICPECSLFNVKVLDDGGSGYWDWLVDGALAAISKIDELQKINPLYSATFNFSIAGPGPVPIIDEMLEVAYKKEIVVVAAAGNSSEKVGGSGGRMLYPAAAPGVLVAVASNAAGGKAPFSSYGKDLLSFACPGVNIVSTVPKDGRPMGSPTGYAISSGTSMAAPCGTGAIAHMRGTAALHGVMLPRELVIGMVLGSASPGIGLENYTASGGVIDMMALQEVPLFPPKPISDFGVFGTNWGSTWLAFMSENDSSGKKPNGFLVHYSEKPFDENTLNRSDVVTVKYNMRIGAGEGVNLRVGDFKPKTHYHIGVQIIDRALNVSTLSPVLELTTQSPKAIAHWTFTTADGQKDPQGWHVEDGPLALLFEMFSGQINPMLWHLSDIASNPSDFRWNWWFGNPGTLNYKTSINADSLIVSEVLDLTDMNYGAEVKMDYFQQFVALTAQTQDYFQVHALILDENNRPIDSVMLLQSLSNKNSKALRLEPIRMDLQPIKDLWIKNQKKANDGSLDKLRVILVLRFLSGTHGDYGGIGSVVGNISILTNP